MKSPIPLWIAMLLALASGSAAGEAKPKPAKPRTLDEIRIEGQVDLPQVLFISSRERIKTQEFHHRRYRMSAQQIAETAGYPRRLTSEKEQ